MSGAEEALEGAILAVLAADAVVQASLGDPLRLAGLDSPQPAYPFLEVVRRQAEPFDSVGSEGWKVTLDLAVISREEGGARARSAIAAVRDVLRNADLPLEGWRCVVLTPAFTDTARQAIGRWRGMLRLRAVLEAED